MNEMGESLWFVDWFNTPFYHDLYRHRDENEAKEWMRKIAEIIPLSKDGPILDVCCGNGRHALYLEALGYSVYGIDIAPENIQTAKLNSQHTDNWKVGDARTMQWNQSFQLVTNLFTSFGYFEEHIENEKLFESIIRQAAEKGYVIIDFLNASKVSKNIVPQEVHFGELTQYHIQRKIANRKIVKTIDFEYNSQKFSFEEKVYLYDKFDFLFWMEKEECKLLYHLGDYSGNPYQEDSPRSIFVFQKK